LGYEVGTASRTRGTGIDKRNRGNRQEYSAGLWPSVRFFIPTAFHLRTYSIPTVPVAATPTSLTTSFCMIYHIDSIQPPNSPHTDCASDPLETAISNLLNYTSLYDLSYRQHSTSQLTSYRLCQWPLGGSNTSITTPLCTIFIQTAFNFPYPADAATPTSILYDFSYRQHSALYSIPIQTLR